MQVRELANPGVVYGGLMVLMARLAQLGLVHCDFNEFNILVRASWSCAMHHVVHGIARLLGRLECPYPA